MNKNENIILAKSEDMKIMDKMAIDELGISSAELMYNAAKAFFDTLMHNDIITGVRKVLILCGAGNNGGDGLAVALFLEEAGFYVKVIKIFEGNFNKCESNSYYKKVLRKSKTNKNIKITEKISEHPDIFNKFDIIIDAVFGTGFKGNFNSEINCIMAKVAESKAKKVSIDIPSGVCCDDGSVCENAFRADLTITFEFFKFGMKSYPAAEYCGEIVTAPIGFTEKVRNYLYSSKNSKILLSSKIIENNIKPREKNSHKGLYGKLLSVCGSENMTGAAYFAALGALRCGVGLLYTSCPEKILHVLQTKLNEPVFMPYIPYTPDDETDKNNFDKVVGDVDNFNAVLFGCGMGISHNARLIFEYLIRNTKSTLILDADGINILSENINILNEKKCELILTPHPMEMARLIGKDTDCVQQNRIETAEKFAAEYSCTVILKGALTVVASYNKSEQKVDVAINSSGNAGLAKGGSGDILAGMVASYSAQGYDPFISACMAVYLHGLAGDLCAEELSQSGMLPSDLEKKIALLQDTEKLKELKKEKNFI